MDRSVDLEVSDSESNSKTKKRTVSDYIIGQKVGHGAFSKVVVVMEKETQTVFAMKAIKKALIVKLKKSDAVFRERNALNLLKGHPFFVNLFCSFQNSEHLCNLIFHTVFLLSYARRGEILRYINAVHGFNVETTRFYASELVCALEYLHSKNLIHRCPFSVIFSDLKPENILVGEDYHIMITDFGTCKFLEDDPNDPNFNLKRQSTFVGTAQYVSPEMILEKLICKSSDLWSLGVVIYQMITTEWAFSAMSIKMFNFRSEYYIFEKIKNLDYKFSNHFPPLAKDLVFNLIKSNPYERLGDFQTGGIEKLKAHAFFKHVDWENIEKQHPPGQMRFCNIELLPTISLDE